MNSGKMHGTVLRTSRLKNIIYSLNNGILNPVYRETIADRSCRVRVRVRSPWMGGRQYIETSCRSIVVLYHMTRQHAFES